MTVRRECGILQACMEDREPDYTRIVAVTDRHLCRNDYFEQIRKIASLGVKFIIIREKDLTETEYMKLFERAINSCEKEGAGTKCFPHYYWRAALRFNTNGLHLPLDTAKQCIGDDDFRNWRTCGCRQLGISVHSVEQASEAAELGASYVTAGHIFITDCKRGMKPRGLDFLKDICCSVDIPVYAIGGINADNYRSTLDAGAAGVCMMSRLMRLERT